MRAIFLTAFLTVLTSPAFAECAAPETTFMSCTFQNGTKMVHVCLAGDAVTYAFGRVGETPELALSVPIENADYTPWPGVSTIWEQMTFHVDNISYVVAAGEHRIYPESEDEDIITDLWGSIEIYENYEIADREKNLASLKCDDGSVEFTWNPVFSEAKQAIGQCWSSYNHVWQACE